MIKLSKGASWTLGVGLMSAAMLGLEIALTNVFGVLLQYHYVSFIVSLAVFGIGAGAYAASRSKQAASAKVTGWVCVGAGLYMGLLSFVLAWFPYVDQLAVYTLLCAVPFLLFGWMTGCAFRSGAARAATIYAADLFGAALGAAAAYMLLNRFGGMETIFLLSVLCFAAGAALFLFPREEGRRGGSSYAFIAAFGAIALIAVWSACGSQSGWRLDFAAMKGAPPDKTIIGTLQSDPSAHIMQTKWDSFARTDTVGTSDENRRILFVDGGAGSYMYKFNGDLSTMGSLARDIEFLPFAAGSVNKAIIVGAGGGRDILYTLMAGAKDVTAVELSQGLVSSMRTMSDYNGSILDHPGVHTVVGDGRSVLEKSREQYDLIVLDLVYSQVGGIGGQALSENYVFTREAFETYLKRLTTDGRIIIISHQGLEGLRAYYTGFDAMLHSGSGDLQASDVAKHTALIMAPEGSAAPNLTLSIIQKSPLSKQQLQLLQAGTKSLGLNPLFLPESNEQLLQPLLEGRTPFDRFVRDSDYNVYPTIDDKPFFFLVQQSLPDSLKQWLIAIVVLTLLFALFMMQGMERRKAGNRKRVGAVAYYALTGIGYMCVQTVLIQKTLYYAGNPVLAAMTVIVAMLLGGSVGSRLAGKLRIKLYVLSAAIVGALVMAALINAAAGAGLMNMAITGRLVAIGAVLFLLGVLLGIPLPAGLRAEEGNGPGKAAFYFSLSGICGVWGAWLAATVSITGGLAVTLGAGCICYALLALTRYRTV
ncbi:spermine/spermidine synthase [Paenibacillus taihuensis]|uniref:Spermine/spermidine synthase n=1 Tax=Paenibacillus taihuensis TaxID=1156355 RepID=A0A3D9SC15_9BACL|nr:class I SAM-dependent methyltransferase [Paenibacillus taihuensis]REE91433.1 spermine/spermidine synthase [Paenibacillus taihuensis]